MRQIEDTEHKCKQHFDKMCNDCVTDTEKNCDSVIRLPNFALKNPKYVLHSACFYI